MTLATLAGALGAVVYSRAEMERIFKGYGLAEFNKGKWLSEKANALIEAVQTCYAKDQQSAAKIITELSEYALKHGNDQSELMIKLKNQLATDGLQWNGEKLIPTTPEPAELEPELSKLEMDMQEIGFFVASKHYRESYESFIAGNWEAANGQLRSFIEDFWIQVGIKRSSNSRSDPLAALQDLRHIDFLDDSEFQMFKAYWQGIQQRGPHRGLSDEREALYRLHIATSISRYVIHKLRSDVCSA
jgi:hypothetical protein